MVNQLSRGIQAGDFAPGAEPRINREYGSAAKGRGEEHLSQIVRENGDCLFIGLLFEHPQCLIFNGFGQQAFVCVFGGRKDLLSAAGANLSFARVNAMDDIQSFFFIGQNMNTQNFFPGSPEHRKYTVGRCFKCRLLPVKIVLELGPVFIFALDNSRVDHGGFDKQIPDF